MPESLTEMLTVFNGGELFLKNGPMLSIFGISEVPPLSPLEWAPDWYIDVFTPKWRAFRNREDEWAIAMTNYGGLIILSNDETVREWDTSAKAWTAKTWGFAEWFDEVLREGDVYLREE